MVVVASSKSKMARGYVMYGEMRAMKCVTLFGRDHHERVQTADSGAVAHFLLKTRGFQLVKI